MSTKTAKVDQQNKPKAADAWSNVGLYASGHRPTMEQYLKEGYTDCASGGGPWCENKHGVMRRIVGIFVFYHQDGRVAMVHYHTYPRTPKMNAHLERFNRTIQDEFIDFHMTDLLTPQIFNRKLMEYLAFYNTERVHWAFGNKQSPVQFILSLQANQLPKDCKSGWPHTYSCFFQPHGL